MLMLSCKCYRNGNVAIASIRVGRRQTDNCETGFQFALIETKTKRNTRNLKILNESIDI